MFRRWDMSVLTVLLTVALALAPITFGGPDLPAALFHMSPSPPEERTAARGRDGESGDDSEKGRPATLGSWIMARIRRISPTRPAAPDRTYLPPGACGTKTVKEMDRALATLLQDPDIGPLAYHALCKAAEEKGFEVDATLKRLGLTREALLRAWGEAEAEEEERAPV